MLASTADAVPSGSGWLHEVKLDGYRLLARLAPGRAPELWSRRGNDYGERFARLRDALGQALPDADCVLDGEAVAADAAGRPSFDLLQRGEGTLALYVSDLLERDGE